MAGLQTLGWTDVEQVLMVTREPVLLWGRPGTGKTTIALRAVRAAAGREPVMVTLTPDAFAAELLGIYVPSGNGFAFQPGPLTVAMQEGRPIVLNELDKASTDVTSLLHEALDDPAFAQASVAGDLVVRPEPGFRVVATSNAPPDVLPESLADRFCLSFHLVEPHPDLIRSLSEDLRPVAERNASVEDRERLLSIRSLIAFDRLRRSVGEHVAAIASFGDRAPEVLDAIRLGRTWR